MKPPEVAVRTLYEELLAAWNRRDARGYAALFAPDGALIEYDGGHVPGLRIEEHLTPVFVDDALPSYVFKVREVRPLSDEVVLLRAIAGMIPPGRTVLDPAANTVQSLVAQQRSGVWRIALFHNIQVRYRGRPELARQHTDELRQVLRRSADRADGNRNGRPI
ncbi:SgcJ/EcaC family oxidoreductase [Actinoallomurus rhizosphaericola]|uniref:SgcJ/EcaC family oxidoreductase n=1 Tax=Actinoallomurus rhizosphaericola TaxID=2952536 RepID=UPI0020911F26|nr:SgcJ/EcaC family oxidoreductase [Actinoallomurus rhizosphaericola]MCO5991909.1 SgcJ/EcaC family oxidoreductase [Actinoallomurus rhizosphaericola]